MLPIRYIDDKVRDTLAVILMRNMSQTLEGLRLKKKTKFEGRLISCNPESKREIMYLLEEGWELMCGILPENNIYQTKEEDMDAAHTFAEQLLDDAARWERTNGRQEISSPVSKGDRFTIVRSQPRTAHATRAIYDLLTTALHDLRH